MDYCSTTMCGACTLLTHAHQKTRGHFSSRVSYFSVLDIFTVVVIDGKCCDIEVGNGSYINSDSFCAVRTCAFSKTLHTTSFTEKMCDMLFVKSVLGEIFCALLKRKLGSGNKCE